VRCSPKTPESSRRRRVPAYLSFVSPLGSLVGLLPDRRPLLPPSTTPMACRRGSRPFSEPSAARRRRRSARAPLLPRRPHASGCGLSVTRRAWWRRCGLAVDSAAGRPRRAPVTRLTARHGLPTWAPPTAPAVAESDTDRRGRSRARRRSPPSAEGGAAVDRVGLPRPKEGGRRRRRRAGRPSPATEVQAPAHDAAWRADGPSVQQHQDLLPSAFGDVPPMHAPAAAPASRGSVGGA